MLTGHSLAWSLFLLQHSSIPVSPPPPIHPFNPTSPQCPSLPPTCLNSDRCVIEWLMTIGVTHTPSSDRHTHTRYVKMELCIFMRTRFSCTFTHHTCASILLSVAQMVKFKPSQDSGKWWRHYEECTECNIYTHISPAPGRRWIQAVWWNSFQMTMTLSLFEC